MPFTLHVPGKELYDDEKNEFFVIKPATLVLEHSLVSMSKWESKWCKPFLTNKKSEKRTMEETIDYIRCMTITQNVDPNIYYCLTGDMIKQIVAYIESPQTATWFSETEKKSSGDRKIVTSELIYCWMVNLNIPFECQKWHLNRLLTLIRVINAENEAAQKNSKMGKGHRPSKQSIQNRNALNEARRKAAGSRG